MAVYHWSKMPEWATKTRNRMDYVFRQATTDMLADIETVPGIIRGGSRVYGTIPVNIGTLKGSLVSESTGGGSGRGESSFFTVIGSSSAGDSITFSWGEPFAPYARWVHDGANGVDGTFWTERAASQWGSYVTKAVIQGKAKFP